jgi:hypothetical protein
MGFDIFVLCRALLLLNQSGNGKSRSLGRSGREFGEPIFGRLFDSPKYYSTRVGLFPRATVLRLRRSAVRHFRGGYRVMRQTLQQHSDANIQ